MVASLRGGVGSSRRRKDSPQDDEPDSAACGGELAHAWRSLVRKDRSDARGDRHVTFGRTTWLGIGCPEGKRMDRRGLWCCEARQESQPA